MKKRKVFNLLIVCLIALGCFVSGSWLGSRSGYVKGRLKEKNEAHPFRLYMYMQMYDLRKQVDFPKSPIPENLPSPINTMYRVNLELSFYEKSKQEDQERWMSSRGFRCHIEQAKKIREALQEALIQENIAATNSVVDQTIQQPMEPATNSSSRTVEAETVD